MLLHEIFKHMDMTTIFCAIWHCRLHDYIITKTRNVL